MSQLFQEFTKLSAVQWKEQIKKDLKGIDFDSLVSENLAGLTIQPFYTAEDLKEIAEPILNKSDWEIAIEVKTKEEESNQIALQALNAGASSLFFHINHSQSKLEVLLKDISIEHVLVNFYVPTGVQDFLTNFNGYLAAKKVDLNKLKGAIIVDPFSQVLLNGNWNISESEDLKQALLPNQLNSQLHTLCVDGGIYHNAGANAVFELACILAHAHELLVNALNNEFTIDRLVKKAWIKLAVGSDFFAEIAKLRSLRNLWALVTEQYALAPDLFIHAETSLLNKSVLDPHNNMLRTTTEAMSAILGGCNSLLVHSFDSVYKEENEFGLRIARNQQLILKEESYLNKVADIGAGSYYLESLTEQLSIRAWHEFKEIETMGGYLKAIKSGYIQNKIENQFHQQTIDVKEGRRVLLGVNKYPNLQEVASKQKDALVVNSSPQVVQPILLRRLAKEMENQRFNVKTI